MIFAYKLILEADPEVIDRKIYNVAGENLTVLQIAQKVQSQMENSCKINIVPVLDQRSYRVSGEKIATEIRHLQRSEVLEAEEYFSKGQKGSSAMPHKRNPIVSERICGLARLLRGNAMAAMENNALWHERDISHSSVERVICPDSTITLDYMLELSINMIDKLLVYPETMKSNIEKTYGLVFSQTILLEFVRRGLTREESYALVQRSAMKTWQEKTSLLLNLTEDEEVTNIISEQELKEIFGKGTTLQKSVDIIFERCGL